MNYGRAIRTIRVARGLSQDELAESSGVSAGYVSLIESGKREPSTSVLERLSESLHAPMPIVALLAAEGSELRGIDSDTASALGAILVRVLTSLPDAIEQ